MAFHRAFLQVLLVGLAGECPTVRHSPPASLPASQVAPAAQSPSVAQPGLPTTRAALVTAGCPAARAPTLVRPRQGRHAFPTSAPPPAAPAASSASAGRTLSQFGKGLGMTAQAVSVAQPIVPGFSSMMAPIYTAPVAAGVVAGGAVAPYPTPMATPLAAGPTMISPVRARAQARGGGCLRIGHGSSISGADRTADKLRRSQRAPCPSRGPEEGRPAARSPSRALRRLTATLPRPHPRDRAPQKDKLAGLFGAATAAKAGGAVYGAGVPVLTAPGIIGGAAPMFAGGIQYQYMPTQINVPVAPAAVAGANTPNVAQAARNVADTLRQHVAEDVNGATASVGGPAGQQGASSGPVKGA
jgi:hypothetical protein